MKVIYIISTLCAASVLLSCSPKKEQFTADLCYPQDKQFTILEIHDEYLSTFNNAIKVSDRGHFLRGVYAFKGETVYASIYEGAKKDSLLHALADPNAPKDKLGKKYTWWANDSVLYLNSAEQIVMVSFPKKLAADFIPKNGSSILFEICD